MLKIDKKSLVTLAAISGLLVFLSIFGLLSPVEGLLDQALSPFFSRLQSLGADVRGSFSEKQSSQELSAELERLRSQVNELTAANAELRATEDENRILREYLQFFTEHGYQYILGNVISRGDVIDIARQTETITIDKGKRDGLVPGLAVVSGEGVLLGKLAEVKDSVSRVYLTNNSQCKLAAMIQNDDSTSGIAEGELGLTIRMNFIPQTQKVEVGDTVVSSGLEESIPRGLVIGTVQNVNRTSNELWQTAQLSPLVDTDSLTIVSVLLPE